MRVELVSKRFERLQAARARAMERASRPPREAAAPMSVSSRAASTASRATTPGSSRRADRPTDRRDAPARWWEAADASGPDRGGDEPPAAAAAGEGLVAVAVAVEAARVAAMHLVALEGGAAVAPHLDVPAAVVVDVVVGEGPAAKLEDKDPRAPAAGG